MNGKVFSLAARIIAVVVLAVGTGVLAQDAPIPRHLSGLINDYTPETILQPNGANPLLGPWEMRGHWSLDFKGHSGTAKFSAFMNMTHSDGWVLALNAGNFNDNTADATGRHPHTHHITIADGTVTQISDTEFTVSGSVDITNDGGATPFAAACVPATQCTLTVDVTGGTLVRFSNITMTFGGPAGLNGPIKHFGSQAIHGVVRPEKGSHDNDKDN